MMLLTQNASPIIKEAGCIRPTHFLKAFDVPKADRPQFLSQGLRPERGNAYAFKELSDRAYGPDEEHVEFDVSPYREMSDDDLRTRVAELERQLGLVPALPPAEDGSKVN